MNRALMLGIMLLCLVSSLNGQAPSQPPKPFTQVELVALTIAKQKWIELTLPKRGISFPLTDEYIDDLKGAGAWDELIAALRKAPAPTAPAAGSAAASGASAGTQSVGPEAAAQDNQVLAHLLAAAKFKQDHAWPEAEKEFRAALAIEPNNPLLHIDLATVLPRYQGEHGSDPAWEECRVALHLAPDSAVSHLELGLNLDLRGKREEAIAEYREAVRLDPDCWDAWQTLSHTLRLTGNLEGAVAALNEALHRNPGEPWDRMELALMLESKGDLDGAIAQVRQALQTAPNMAVGHIVLARILRAKGDAERAAQEAQIGNDLRAKDPPKRLRIGGKLAASRVLYNPPPTYPSKARRENLQGQVRLRVVIGQDGTIQDLQVISGHPLLTGAAMKAVSKWRFDPTLLNGQPAEVETEIVVNFTLDFK